MKRLPYLLVAVGIVAADLLTKALAFGHLAGAGFAEGEVDWVFGRWFGWAMVKNRGVTGGMGSGASPTLITALTLIAVVAILVYLLRSRSLPGVVGSALALILGGAAGNLYDRLRFEYVRDFVDVWPGLPWPSWLRHWPTFNVADAAIVTGVLLLLFDALLLARRRKGREEGAGKAAG